jgi:hypothetical protein
MDLEAARKSLSKQSRFSPKKIAFGVVVGLVFVTGIGLRVRHYLDDAPAQNEPAAVEAPVAVPPPAPEASPPPPAETTESIPAPTLPAETNQSLPATAPSTQEASPAPAELAGDTAGQTDQADLPGAGMILVSRKPVEVRSGPSASAPAMYGFPAGRPFRVVGREAGFVQIQDLKSSASGWIDEAALAPPPSRSVAAPPASKPGALDRKPATAAADPKLKVGKKAAPVNVASEPAPDPDPAEAPRRPGLLGGLFGGIFGNGNTN